MKNFPLNFASGPAETVVIDGICYDLDLKSRTAAVKFKLSGHYSGAIVIPTKITYDDTEYSVAKIEDWAFSKCNALTSITIPNSITSIGNWAFADCSGMTYIKIPNSVTSIGNSAFVGCSGLTSITIPNSVTNIGEKAFSSTGWYENQNEGILYLDNWLLGYKGQKPTGEIAIPEGIKGIAGYSFNECSGLTSIKIPNSVTCIGSYALFWCTGLTSITIPNSLASIEEGAFYCCSGLTYIKIPNSVTNIGREAFCGCSSLTTIMIPNSMTSIGVDVFCGCSGLSDVICFAERAPYTSNAAFGDSPINNATLHVPEVAIDAYKSIFPWKNFKSVVGIENSVVI